MVCMVMSQIRPAGMLYLTRVTLLMHRLGAGRQPQYIPSPTAQLTTHRRNERLGFRTPHSIHSAGYTIRQPPECTWVLEHPLPAQSSVLIVDLHIASLRVRCLGVGLGLGYG